MSWRGHQGGTGGLSLRDNPRSRVRRAGQPALQQPRHCRRSHDLRVVALCGHHLGRTRNSLPPAWSGRASPHDGAALLSPAGGITRSSPRSSIRRLPVLAGATGALLRRFWRVALRRSGSSGDPRRHASAGVVALRVRARRQPLRRIEQLRADRNRSRFTAIPGRNRSFFSIAMRCEGAMGVEVGAELFDGPAQPVLRRHRWWQPGQATAPRCSRSACPTSRPPLVKAESERPAGRPASAAGRCGSTTCG